MLSLKTIARILLSFVLLFVFSAGSSELRISIGTIFLWGLGIISHRRNLLSLLSLLMFVLPSFWLLAAKNELFYESTLGRLFDCFFSRPTYDSETPGSGFTDWHEHFTRRHRHGIEFAWSFFGYAIFWTFTFAAIPCIVALCHWYAALPQRMPGLTDTIEYLDRTGELPPWFLKAQVQAPEPQPRRDTRHMHLSNDLVLVCGRGGGFGRVVGDNYTGAVSRRRGLSKEFA